MEPHVKERIVGAAVLVAVGVWLIPWILDGPDDVVAEPEVLPEILLPAAEPIVPLKTETAATESPPADVVDEAFQPPSESLAAATDAPTTRPQATPAQSQPPAETAADASVATPAPPPAAPPASTEPAPDRSGWSVQLGAFGEKANADQLVKRVATYGYDAYVAEFRSNGERMYRVRVGGFASENLADAAASAISAHSITVRVISPE